MTPTADRFMRHVDRAGPDGCWLWTGAKTQFGYGAFRMFRPKRTVGAHRVSYELYKGPILLGMHVCHACDNPSCVNPAHLWIGTAGDNARDRDAKDRVQHGQTHYAAKLTEEDVAEIIKCSGTNTQTELARKFRVDPSNISQILSGKRWKRLQNNSAGVAL